MTKAYQLLCSRIDRFTASVRARYGDQMTCRPTCADCCEAGLTLVLVEAVALGEWFGLAPERVHLLAGQPPLFTDGRCALLESDDLCAAYDARPLICRTHGLPLRYPDTDALRFCDKNFPSEAPHGSAVLDVEAMETALFAANLDYCRQGGLNPLSRVPIDRIATLIRKTSKTPKPVP